MKNLIKAFINTLTVFSIFYLGGVFINVSFDISKWNQNNRELTGSSATFICLMVFIASCIVYADQKNAKK